MLRHYVRAECPSCGWKGTLAGTEGFARTEAEQHSCLDVATRMPPRASRAAALKPTDVDGVGYDLARGDDVS
jgi:hypothetical protein